MAETLWQSFQIKAKERAADIAIQHGTEAIGFGDMLYMAQGWASLLDARPGDRVVIAGRNSIALASAIPGIWARGAIPVFVHAEAPDHHIQHAVEQTDAVALLLDNGRELPALAATTRKFPLNCPKASAPATRKLTQNGSYHGSIVFTSGSTGAPKGVVQTASNLASGVARIATALGYRQSDRILCPIPFAFDYGWGQLLSLLIGGMTLVLPETRGAAGICNALAQFRPTILAGVPAVFAELVSGMSPIRDTDRSSIRLITNTGSRIPDPVRVALRDLLPDAALSLNYGLTETYRSATLPLSEADSHPASVGYAMPGVRLSVVREDGSEAAPEEEGEIVHHGEGRFLCYWNDPKRTADVLRPDPLWNDNGSDGPPPLVVFTGDLGRKDSDGRLYIHGRRDRQMKSMGVRVSPDEIERILTASGQLREIAVTSKANDMLGDMIVAVISLLPNSEETSVLKSLKAYARKHMSPYMQPREYILQENLPRNPNGKVDYPALKRMVSISVAGQT
jgi:long-chain acyl-CoA synthetase